MWVFNQDVTDSLNRPKIYFTFPIAMSPDLVIFADMSDEKYVMSSEEFRDFLIAHETYFPVSEKQLINPVCGWCKQVGKIPVEVFRQVNVWIDCPYCKVESGGKV